MCISIREGVRPCVLLGCTGANRGSAAGNLVSMGMRKPPPEEPALQQKGIVSTAARSHRQSKGEAGQQPAVCFRPKRRVLKLAASQEAAAPVPTIPTASANSWARSSSTLPASSEDAEEVVSSSTAEVPPSPTHTSQVCIAAVKEGAMTLVDATSAAHAFYACL